MPDANGENTMAEPRSYAPQQFSPEPVSLFKGLTLRQVVEAQELVSQELRDLAMKTKTNNKTPCH
jgi:hypothetical protein